MASAAVGDGSAYGADGAVPMRPAEFVSIGPYCETAHHLLRNGVRHCAYPFDWAFTSLAMVQHCIEDDFKIFLDTSYYKRGSKRGSTRHMFYNGHWMDTPLLHAHHAKHRVYFNPERVNTFNHHALLYNPAHYEAYVRRVERFRALLASKTQIVLVYYNPYIRGVDDIVAFAEAVSKNPCIYVIGIWEIEGEPQTILHETGNCKVYMNWEIKVIFDEWKRRVGIG